MYRTRISDPTETSRQRLSVAYEVFNGGQESNVGRLLAKFPLDCLVFCRLKCMADHFGSISAR